MMVHDCRASKSLHERGTDGVIPGCLIVDRSDVCTSGVENGLPESSNSVRNKMGDAIFTGRTEFEVLPIMFSGKNFEKGHVSFLRK